MHKPLHKSPQSDSRNINEYIRTRFPSRTRDSYQDASLNFHKDGARQEETGGINPREPCERKMMMNDDW